MKKLLVLLLLTVTTLLVSCEQPQEDPPPIDDTGCDSTQLDIDGECITLTGPQQQLYQVLETMPTYDSYHVSVRITDAEGSETQVHLKYDGSTSFYSDGQETIYTEQDGTDCLITTVLFDVETQETVTCEEGSTRFYDHFTYDMFTLESGLYQIDASYLSAIESSMSTFIEGATLTSITMMIDTDHITSITASIDIHSNPFTIVFDFLDYNNTTIEVPSEVTNS